MKYFGTKIVYNSHKTPFYGSYVIYIEKLCLNLQ